MGQTNKKPRSRRNYSDQQLLCAIQAIRDGSRQCDVTKKYGIPLTTLYHKITGRTELFPKPSGGCTVLSAGEESVFEKWILNLAERGFPFKKQQLLRSVQLYLNKEKRNTAFRNNLPGIHWYINFFKRHPIISEKKSENRTPRKSAVTQDHIKRWHANLYKYCEENNLKEALNDPNRIFNIHEKGFILKPQNEVVLTNLVERALFKRSPDDEKECVTALLGGNASGMSTPPMIVYAYNRMPSNIQQYMPAKCWSLGISDNGCQTLETFYDYITNVFHKWLLEEKIKLPVILFIDGNKSYISLNLSDFCAANQIELLALCPKSEHLIQPMDVGVLKPVNTSWGEKFIDWKLTHNNAKIQNTDVASILNDVINIIDYASCLREGFKKSGLFPFNINSIDLSKILPSTEVAAASQNKLWQSTKGSGPNSVQILSENEKREEALHLLKHFEGLIDDVILHSFKFSKDKWSGPKEYDALYETWKILHIEASDSSIVTLDVDSLNPQVHIDTSNKESEQCSMLVDNSLAWTVADNAQSLNSEELGSMTADYDENTSCKSTDLSIDEQCIVIEIPHAQDLPEKIIEPTNGSSENVPGLTSPYVPNDLSRENYPPVLKTSSNKEFDVDAFKKSFFWPIADIKKKKKRLLEIRSTVITSLDWRCKEREKMENKLKIEAEKKAKKVARETKRLKIAALRAEKEIVKEMKKKN